MEPLQINIGVTVNLGESTIQALGALFSPGGHKEPAPERKPEPKKIETKPATQPEVKDEPTPAPEAPAEEPAEITDEALRALIKEVRTATSPAAVRAVFNEFGIKTSIECPQERRADLVGRLKQLAA